MPWGAAIGAGVGLVSSYFGNKSAANSAKEVAEINKAPWSGQQPYIKAGYTQAQDALNSALGKGTYQGQYTADLNPFQTSGFNQLGQFAQNQGANAANTVLGAGQANIGAASTFGNNAQAMFNQAGQDPTQQIMGNAGQYANSPYLDGQIDAASRDVTRNLNENQLTGLDLAAAGSGNMNSSRTGVAQGIMQRGAGDRIADISAQMRGNAYQNGLGMAQAQYNTGVNQMAGANGQLLQAGQFGADQMNNGVQLGYGSGLAQAQAGQGFQTQQQNVLNGQKQQFSDQQNNSLDLVNKYMSTIGSPVGAGGGAGSPQMQNPVNSMLSGALGGASLYGQWQKSNQGYDHTQTPGYGDTSMWNAQAGQNAIANGGWGIE